MSRSAPLLVALALVLAPVVDAANETVVAGKTAAVNASNNCLGESSNLQDGECALWQNFYDTVNGQSWTHCQDKRNDPCSCFVDNVGLGPVEVQCNDEHITNM